MALNGKTGFACVLLMVLAFSVFTWCQPAVMFRLVERIPLVGWLVAYNFPPSDFYTPLAECELREGVQTRAFACKYRGRHEVQIVPVEDALDVAPLATRVRMWNSKQALVLDQAQTCSQILGGKVIEGKRIYNYCCAIFEVPEHAQLGEEMVVEIDCQGDVQAIVKRNPTARIVVVKVFDK